MRFRDGTLVKIKPEVEYLGCFLNDDADYEIKDGIKVDTLSHALQEKLKLYEKESRTKDYIDFVRVINCFKNDIFISLNGEVDKETFSFENFKNIFFSK